MRRHNLENNHDDDWELVEFVIFLEVFDWSQKWKTKSNIAFGPFWMHDNGIHAWKECWYQGGQCWYTWMSRFPTYRLPTKGATLRWGILRFTFPVCDCWNKFEGISPTMTMTRYARDMLKVCPKYAQEMTKICPRYVQDMPEICPRYAQDMPEKYAKNGAKCLGAKCPLFLRKLG